MSEEPIFPWCPDCLLYNLCYANNKINFIEEDCRWTTASNSYVNEVLSQAFIYN